jgi:hypothetical protein
MSASSARKGASSEDLPEVFVLKKEVQFDAWRRVFSEACKFLRVKKILKSTPSERPYRWVYGKLCGSGASLKQYTTYWGTEKSQSESRNKHLV